MGQDGLALEALAAWQERFRDPAFEFARWFRLTDEARRFVQDCYDHGWILDDLDWAAWASSAEAQRLRDEPGALAAAAPGDLARLLTSVVRGDRFNEGDLLAAWESGLLRGVVDRAARLAESATGD